ATNYYPQSSGSKNVPHSNYSSLSNAVPTQQSTASPGYHNGTQPYPQASDSHGYSSAPSYGGGQPGYGPSTPASQYPPTAYNPGSGQYPNTSAYNSQYPSTQPPYSSSVPAYNTSQYAGNYSSSGPYAGQYAPGTMVDPGASIKQCYNCGTMSTPLWRRDPTTQRILCNACGLYQHTRREPRPQALIDAENEQEDPHMGGGGDGPQCSHCFTRKTSVWRRNKDGEQVCNACGVYYRVNGRERPLSMTPSKVKPRAKHSQLEY
ncbi:hypothetical protein B0H14DRAFT_2757703, partial [Mycena olivaceomarginata]